MRAASELHSTLMYRLKQNIDKILPLIGTSRVAFLDYPVYGNIGDLLIMAGTLDFFRTNGIAVSCAYEVSPRGCPTISPDETIVFQGGGNFGDLYPGHQAFRETVISSHLQNRIVVFPQTIYFSSESTFENTCKLMRQHLDLHIFCRDRYSLEKAGMMTPNVSMMPDMAHYLWNTALLEGTPHADNRISGPTSLGLFRTDNEKQERDGHEIIVDRNVDWSSLIGTKSRFIRRFRKVFRLSQRLGLNSRTISRLKLTLWERYAMHLMKIAVDEFSTADTIVTDRLHGHILASLLQKKHIILDNNYGKIFNYNQLWLQESPLVTLSVQQ